jgi:hypothetical protein
MGTYDKQHHEKTGPAIDGVQNTYKIAYNEATAALAGFSLQEIAKKSGSAITTEDGHDCIRLPFLGDAIIITHPDISVSYLNRNDDVPVWAGIIILHYLNPSGKTTAQAEEITFQELAGGRSYYPAFVRRTVTPLLNAFGPGLDGFMESGIAAGGIRAPYSDHALSFQAFPKVRIAYVMRRGDDEFPASGSVIFDSSIAEYLPTEDVAVLCGMIAIKIIKARASA